MKTSKPGQKEISSKQDAFAAALTQIESKFGKEAIMRLGDQKARIKVPVIPTGALTLDIALGIGGIPRGRVIEIYGAESSGKTTLALHIIAETQKRGGIAAFIDVEHALDYVYAKNLGVDVENLWVSQPDTGEQALGIVETLIKSGAVDLIVVDSVAALAPQGEIEGNIGDSHIGLQARLMSQALRKITGILGKSNTSLIFTNQIRQKISTGFPGYGGPSEVTTGGMALKFYASVRLEIKKIETLKKGEEVRGLRARVRVVKNKMAPPYRNAEFDIFFGEGISKEGCIIDAGLEYNILTKMGTWLSYGDQRLGQAREAVVKFLKEHPDIAQEIEKKILEKAGIKEIENINENETKKDEKEQKPEE